MRRRLRLKGHRGFPMRSVDESSLLEFDYMAGHVVGDAVSVASRVYV